MKITRSDESVLALVDCPLSVGVIALALAIVPLAKLVHDIARRGIGWPEGALPLSMATILALFVGALFTKRSTFVFDRRRRNLTWRRRSLFGARGGTVPFDAVRSAVVETTVDSPYSGLQYRVTLITDGGGIPVTEYYTLGAGERCERLRDEINHFMNAKPRPHPDDDIREMARGGHSARAVALAKQRLGLSTSEAVRFVDDISKSAPDDPAHE